MYLSLNWLKDFVNIPKSITPEELGLRLTMHTVEIDSVAKQADKFKNVVVGKILEIKKHPKADRLQLVKVDIGKEKLNIVCGARNILVGQRVPVALVGSRLPNRMEIKEVNVRGEKSVGMLCAEDELGLGNDHSGIMILDKGKVGQNFGEYLGLKDIVFEVDNKSITHRPDLWSHYGMARDIAAFLDTRINEFKTNLTNLTKKIKEKEQIKLDVKVNDFKLCPRYMAIVVSGIEIKDSPGWMQERLVAVGLRPINNIVDITNYVMLELGQPLHAFDLKLVDGIVVRQAKKNESLETLDGQKRELDEGMLVIADRKKPIAVAGVMGGAGSEISKDTTAIILEAANFEHIQVRKTSQKLGLRTEASIRFEKALDPNLCETALARTIELIKKICPKAKIISQLVDEKKFDPAKIGMKPIELDLVKLNKFIGEEIEKKKVIKILNNLGFKIKDNNDKLEVIVPTWRATGDISIPEDLMEEVVRIYGYDNLKPKMPKVVMKAPEFNERRWLEREAKKILSLGAGLTEVYNYSFVGEELLRKLKTDSADYVRLANPITSQHTLLRQSLVPTMLKNIKSNQAQHDNIKIFEIGDIYLNFSGEINKDNKAKENLLYQEKRIALIIAGGKKYNAFSQIKGVIEYLADSFSLEVNFEPAEICPGWVDKKALAKICLNNNKDIGVVFKLDSQVAGNLGIKKEAAGAEINFNELFALIFGRSEKKYKEKIKFPPIVRDLAFVVNNEILYNDIKEEIANSSQLIKAVELFDVFAGGRLGKDKKNLAFHIIYQSENKTLTAEEIDKVQAGLIKNLKNKFVAQIRDF